MKKEKALFITGSLLMLVAFLALATGAVLTNIWLFVGGALALAAGITFSMIIPAIIERNWIKLINEHGVPATAHLINSQAAPTRFAAVRLDFLVDGTDTVTSDYCPASEKDNFKLDAIFNIKYNPSDPIRCIVVSEVKPKPNTESNMESIETDN